MTAEKPRLDTIDRPLSWLSGLSTGGRMLFMAQAEPEHSSRSGFLDQSAATGELRNRFQYDRRWGCDECRFYLERDEGDRILTAFDGLEMWVACVRETTEERIAGEVRDRIRREASGRGVQFVTVPLYIGLVVLSTGPLDGTSERVDDHGSVVRGRVMPHRWKHSDTRAGVSSSQGFLLPAREYHLFEAYTKDPADRCWHLHRSRDEAKECAGMLGLDTGRRWYTRGTSEWHGVGRLTVTGGDLERLARDHGIRFEYSGSKEASLVFEPMEWTDRRLRGFLEAAGWTPPRPDWKPPRIEIQYRLVVRTGDLTRAGGWTPKKTG